MKPEHTPPKSIIPPWSRKAAFRLCRSIYGQCLCAQRKDGPCQAVEPWAGEGEGQC